MFLFSAIVFLICIAIDVITGASSDVRLLVVQNNNDPNATSKQIGSWNNWMTGFHVNEKHDGYLDIGQTKFNAENLNLTYSVNTNCSSEISLFADGRIFCTSNNMIFSYYPQNGSVSFWYLTIGSNYLNNPSFVNYGSSSSVFTYSYNVNSNVMNMYLFNALSGELQHQDTFISYRQSPYVVGSQSGFVYFTSKETSSSTPTYPASIYAYDVDSYQFSQSDTSVEGSTEVPSICNNLIIVSGYYASTNAYNKAPGLDFEWSWPGKGHSASTSSPPPPVCLKNENGYRVIVKPYSLTEYNCYLLNVLNGHLIDSFNCGTVPIIHYNKDNGYADIAIMGTGSTNQIIAVAMYGDNVIGEELWYGSGNINYAFIVKDYVITAWKEGSYSIKVNVYDINNGDVKWNTYFDDIGSSATYSVFGGLVENENGLEEFIMMIRVGKTLYAYKELEI